MLVFPILIQKINTSFNFGNDMISFPYFYHYLDILVSEPIVLKICFYFLSRVRMWLELFTIYIQIHKSWNICSLWINSFRIETRDIMTHPNPIIISFSYSYHHTELLDSSIQLHFLCNFYIFQSNQQMDDQDQQTFKLQNGEYYLIINVFTGKALSIDPQYSRSPNIQKIVQQSPNENNIRQVWMLEQIKPNQWQIIHFQSTLVMENNKGQIRLKIGDQKPNTLFCLKLANPDYINKYCILQKQQGECLGANLICLDQSLKCKYSTLKDSKSIWQLRLVRNNQILNTSCILISAYSLKAIDVPGASFNEQVPLIQYTVNKRCNQRWLIKKVNSDYYSITSLLNDFSLDIRHGYMHEGTPIIQYRLKNQKNQLWKLEYIGKNLYLIKSAKDQNFMLSINGNSLNDLSNICISENEGYSYWKIIGSVIKQ